MLLVCPQVEPRTEECFFEDLKVGDKMTINFEVIRGGLLDIEFKLKDPMGNVAFQRLAFFNHKFVAAILCSILLQRARGRFLNILFFFSACAVRAQR